MKKTYLLLFLFITVLAKSQNDQKKQLKLTEHNKESVRRFGVIRCLSTEADSLSRLKYPERGTIDEFENWLAPKIIEYKRQVANGTLSRATVLTIPVVVHVIHDGDAIGTGENISDAQVLSQIRVLNEDFRRILGTPGYNTNPLGADIEIEFCMAQTAPNGTATNGIDRVNTGVASYTSMAATDAMKTTTIWDPTQYLNMWSVRFGGGMAGTLGYAQFPDNSGLAGLAASGGPANTDGVVSSFDAFGSQAYAAGTYNPTYNLGRTMTHEVGHWVGLRHIWGDGDCTVDDFCADTPGSDAANFGCPNTNSCVDAAPDPRDMVENYMDYTDDACMNIFTQDQKTRIRTVFTLSPRRMELASSTKCQPPAPIIGFNLDGTTINEGTDCGYQDVVLTLGIQKAPSSNATVSFTSSGSATLGLDFDIFPSSVVFNAGSTASQTVTVRIFNDGVLESVESVLIGLTISTSGDAILTTGILKDHLITINDDDYAPSPSVVVDIINADFNSGANGFTSTGNAGSDLFSLGTTATASSTFWNLQNTNNTQFAFTNDDRCNCNKNNDMLISPIFSLAGYTNATLTFDHAFGDVVAAEVGEVRISTNGGTTWTTIQNLTNTSTTTGSGIYFTPWVNGNTINLAPYLGQNNVRIAFRYRDGGGWNYGMAVDNVRVFSSTVAVIQEAVNSTNKDNGLLRNNETVNWYDPATNNVMGTIQNASTFDYGCTTVEVDRSQVSLGAATGPFIDAIISNHLLAKTFYVNPTNDNATGNYTVSFYYTNAEVTAWELATGKSRTELHVIKVVDNSISLVNDTNFSSYTIEEIPVIILAFGSNVIFQATFSTNLRGGYAIGPKSQINCGDIITTWNGSAWSNGNPNKQIAVIVNGNYDTNLNGSFECCSLVVNSGVDFNIKSNDYILVVNEVTNNGNFSISNNGSLIQENDLAVNSGNISYERIASVKLQDYVYWSSPISGFHVNNISPLTPSSYYWTWNPTILNSNSGQGNWVNVPSSIMSPGVGYIVRAPNGFSNSVNQNWVVNFSNGVPNNGIYTPVISRGNNTNSGFTSPSGVTLTDTDDNWNLIGNPYPSSIGINAFLSANSDIDGFVRLWTHSSLPTNLNSGSFYGNFNSNYAASDYITINGAGSTSGPGTLSVIGGGQSFFVLMNPGLATTSTVVFNNAMRDKLFSNSQFYRTTNATNEIENHRIWLDLVSSNETSRTLISYNDRATNGRDRLYDAITNYRNLQGIYTMLENQPMVIQGKALPFIDEDVIALGVKIPSNGQFTIAIGALDGLFANQNIYLKDKLNNSIHDLKTSPYSFNADAGILNNRFEIIYKNEVLGNEDFLTTSVSIYVESNTINITSKDEIEEVYVFDVLGRKLYENKSILNSSFALPLLNSNNQALIVKVKLKNGQIHTQKIIL